MKVRQMCSLLHSKLTCISFAFFTVLQLRRNSIPSTFLLSLHPLPSLGHQIPVGSKLSAEPSLRCAARRIRVLAKLKTVSSLRLLHSQPLKGEDLTQHTLGKPDRATQGLTSGPDKTVSYPCAGPDHSAQLL